MILFYSAVQRVLFSLISGLTAICATLHAQTYGAHSQLRRENCMSYTTVGDIISREDYDNRHASCKCCREYDWDERR